MDIDNRNIFLHKNDLPKDFYLESNVLAVDTETLGLNLQRDKLCLLQISDGIDVHLVQFLSNEYYAPNLQKILMDNNILKIFHYARFDVAAIAMYLRVICSNIYCTKIASKLVRTYTEKHGLKNLCKELLQVDLSKEQQSSYWGKINLSEEQKFYAAQDVVYLHALMNELDSMLLKENKLEIAKACFNFIPVRAHLDILGYDTMDVFAHS